MKFKKTLRTLILVLIIFFIWKIITILSQVPTYILPPPEAVLISILENYELIISNLFITLTEIILGLFLGVLLGSISAILVNSFETTRAWFLPIIIASQAIPVFTIAPLLVLWFGYGISSKIIMSTLIIYFPVAASFIDGLRQTNANLINLAKTISMHSKYKTLFILIHIQIPSALPSLGSGIRIAAAVAPIGAIIGEWVGASGGLGYLMIQSNARVQIDLMFAVLIVTAFLGIVLYFSIDLILKKIIFW